MIAFGRIVSQNGPINVTGRIIIFGFVITLTLFCIPIAFNSVKIIKKKTETN